MASSGLTRPTVQQEVRSRTKTKRMRGSGLPQVGATIHARPIQIQRGWPSNVPTRASRRCMSLPAAVKADLQTLESLGSKGPVCVWFKGDLRVDDHPGLIAAARSAATAGTSLLPLYCLDSSYLADLAYLPAGFEVLADALASLRGGLRAAGSDLVVVRGAWASAVPAAAQRQGAVAIVAQGEVEQGPATALADTATAAAQLGISCHTWQPHIWPSASFTHNFRDWSASRPPPSVPVDAPTALPGLPPIDPGELPTVAELRALAKAVNTPRTAGGPLDKEAQVAQEWAQTAPAAASTTQLLHTGRSWLMLLAAYLALPPMSATNQPGAGGDFELGPAVAALEVPGARGSSFPALFATALALGALSRRRAYSEAMKAGDGFGSRAVRAVCESADFHSQMAERTDKRPPTLPATVKLCHWRWRGFLTDYYVAEPTNPLPGAPAVLLVHGFGAFGGHWRQNMQPLADAGYRVFAPTLPGFGRSEKAAVPYSQVLWGNFLRDFVLQRVGSQVVVAGNSIGGFIAAGMAADHPSLVKGLVLVNSAGPITPAFSMAEYQAQVDTKKAPPEFLVQVLCGALFWYLERTVKSTLAWVYPIAPEMTVGWLSEEIERAAADVGAVSVFSAVAYLPPPRALNYMINEKWAGPTLVLQGGKDPLNDSKGRAAQLAALCSRHVRVELLSEAGHCPHDERPELFNAAMIKFVSELGPGQARPAYTVQQIVSA